MSISSIRPFLMFQGDGEAALNFYTSVFPDAGVDNVERWGAGEQGPEGAFKRALLRVAGQSVLCFDSPIKHAFSFTPSFSFFVEADSEEDVRRYAEMLGEGGGELMPVANYGFSRLFGWINDRFGVSWQINCARGTGVPA
jgi:predicted 3-demethylubiquinone-9 3-methyltransferase (glyoxalase superfamily)